MEILLVLALGLLGYVVWKQSRGEPVSYGRLAGGCLGIGCLGLVIMLVLGIVLVWILLQALVEVDVSLSELLLEPEAGGPE